MSSAYNCVICQSWSKLQIFLVTVRPRFAEGGSVFTTLPSWVQKTLPFTRAAFNLSIKCGTSNMKCRSRPSSKGVRNLAYDYTAFRTHNAKAFLKGMLSTLDVARDGVDMKSHSFHSLNDLQQWRFESRTINAISDQVECDSLLPACGSASSYEHEGMRGAACMPRKSYVTPETACRLVKLAVYLNAHFV